MRWVEGARARLRLLFARDSAEARMDDEFRFHLEMEKERLMREEGLDAGEARRRALVAFGGVERHREELREGRGLAWLGGLSLDFRLGLRMLVKYPGLTIVGGLAMAFAIWVGAVTFEMVGLYVNPTLPLPGGERIVQIRNWDVTANDPDPRALHDFLVWRGSLRSVTHVGAYRDVALNLITDDGNTSPVVAAEVTESAFRIAPDRPLLGRSLVAADEQVGAPLVVVLGHDVWQARYGSDPNVIGRSVRLGDAYATVVGVMPDGFAFPVAHEVWLPFQPDALEQGPRAGPAITVFGRLAPGVSLETAQTELTTLGRRAAAALPETHEHLQPRVAPYAKLDAMEGDDLAAMLLIEVSALMLLVLVCGNVALLLFARAATREGEIIVRSALGASRRRIVVQLFAEALVLGGVAAVVGLAAARIVLSLWGLSFLEANLSQVPFWYDPRLSPLTVLYACALTVIGAAIAGGLPGLKVTRGLGTRLREGTAGGGGLQFGGVWTAVIVAQVAVTVAFPAVVLVEVRELQRIRSYDVGFAAEEYLAIWLEMDAMPGAGAEADSAAAAIPAARFGMALETLRQRVAAEPGVAGVTFVNLLPRTNYRDYRVELDDSATVAVPAGEAGARAAQALLPDVTVAFVDPSYFEVLEAPILAGRGFQPADLAPGARTVIVDQGFVDHVLLGRNPIGRRVRFSGAAPITSPPNEPAPWYLIVGVVKELGMSGAAEHGQEAGLYMPASPGSGFPAFMMIHAQGDPLSLVPRVRAIAGEVDSTLRLSEFQRVDQVTSTLQWILGLWIRATVVMTAVALLLSLAGIYAVLSFTVARRTREIGVRVALGASRRRLVAGIFRRPLTQVGLGVVAGAALIALGAIAMFRTEQFAGEGAGLPFGQLALLVAYATLMLGVCLLACVVPTRRALGVEPIVAMREE
jgi:putative ABC transport system permease protein